MTTPITAPPWAARVEKLLATQHRTREWLAGEVGVSPSYLTLLLQGKRTGHPAHLTHMADALGVPLAWLQEGTP